MVTSRVAAMVLFTGIALSMTVWYQMASGNGVGKPEQRRVIGNFIPHPQEDIDQIIADIDEQTQRLDQVREQAARLDSVLQEKLVDVLLNRFPLPLPPMPPPGTYVDPYNNSGPVTRWSVPWGQPPKPWPVESKYVSPDFHPDVRLPFPRLPAPPKGVLLNYWNTAYGNKPGRWPAKGKVRIPCEVECYGTEDPSLVDETDAFIYYMADCSEGVCYKPETKRGLQNTYHIAHMEESSSNYPYMLNEYRMSFFNFSLMLDGKATWPQTHAFVPANAKDPIPFEEKTGVVLCLFSNCLPNNDRNEYIKQLLRVMPAMVDCYGKCHHNKEFPKNEGIPDHDVYGMTPDANYRTYKHKLMRRYKFDLVFQNSNCIDFVDEKLWEAFDNGVVPIYMGAPNIDEFLPSNHSIIKVNNFASPSALAQYIMYLNDNPDKYNEYLAWHKDKKKMSIIPDKVKWRYSGLMRYGEFCYMCQKVIDADYSPAPRPRHMARPMQGCCDWADTSGCPGHPKPPDKPHAGAFQSSGLQSFWPIWTRDDPERILIKELV